jgi:aminopeptidase N
MALTSCNSRIEWPGQGVPRSLALERAEQISELTYELSLTVPESQDSLLSGKAIIRFALKKPPQKHLFIDFAGDTTQLPSLTINGKNVKTQYKQHHILVPWSSLQKGANVVAISFRSGNQALNRNSDYLFSLFVPDKARTAIPCFDQPDLKARFTLTLNIPAQWEAVSNAPLSSTQASSSGRKELRFQETHPISTYLFSFAVGRFNKVKGTINGKDAHFYHRENDSLLVQRNSAKLFELHENALKWLENYTGIPYPFEKFDFVLIPAFQYGGMEHPGDIFYRASRLLLSEDASPAEELNRASLIAHETAHMWFGDLVTMKWFDDVWLKEVFANFFAAKMVNPEFPEIDHEARFILTHYPRALGVDRSSGSNPIKQELENLEDAGSLYGDIIYFKAPILMQQLEMLSGAQAFRSGMLTYLHSHKYGNASWEDLVNVLDEITPINLDKWSRDWFFKAELPMYCSTVDRYGTDSIQVSINRGWEGEGYSAANQSFELLLAGETTEKAIRCDIESDINSFLMPWPENQELPVAIMYDGHFYGEQVIAPHDIKRSIQIALTHPSRKIRGALWVALHENFLNHRIETAEFFDAIHRAIEVESSPVILSTQIEYLKECWWLFMSPANRDSLAPDLEELLLERSYEKGLGRIFFNAFRDICITQESIAELYDFWADGHPQIKLNPSDGIALAAALSLRAHPLADSIIRIHETRLEDEDIIKRFNFIKPSLMQSRESWLQFIEQLENPVQRRHEAWALEGLEYIHHPLRADQAIGLLPQCLNMLEEVKRTGDIFFPRSWLDACLGSYNSVEAATIVEDYLKRNPGLPGPLRGKVLQASDLLIRASRPVGIIS